MYLIIIGYSILDKLIFIVHTHASVLIPYFESALNPFGERQFLSQWV